MDDIRHTHLVRLAILLTVAWIGWTVYDSEFKASAPGAYELAAAGKYLEDGNLDEALSSFELAGKLTPDDRGILRGKGQTLMRMGINRNRQAVILEQSGKRAESNIKRLEADKLFQRALKLYDTAIKQEEQQGISDLSHTALGVSFANRGILKDQMGHYEGALRDYQKALSIEKTVADGPGLLTRFMRNQAQRPPSIADRAQYLTQQLAKPESERILRVPKVDAEQHAYKMN